MTYWKPISPESFSTYGLPVELAQSKNHHFYRPNEFEIDNFRLLAFIKPSHRNDYFTFRFWSLNDESGSLDKYNILLSQWGGYISFKKNEIEELIQLLKEYGDMLEDSNPNGHTFQFVLEEEYKDYYIKTRFSLSLESAYYLCVSDVEEIEPNYDKLFRLIFGRDRIIMTIFSLPQNIKSYDEFEVSSYQNMSSLNLTKQGVNELCQLLSRES